MIEPKAWLYEGNLTACKEVVFDRSAFRHEQWTETALYPQSAIDALQAENERLRGVLEIIEKEGLSNHNTRCRSWWPKVRQALEASHDA